MYASRNFIFAIVITIFIVSCAKTTTETTTPTNEIKTEAKQTIACYKDSDCGETKYEDICYQRATVYRQTTNYLCSNPGTENARCDVDKTQKIQQDCGLREVCEDGKCMIPPPSECEETDDGIDEFEKGRVGIGLENYYDECITSGTLKEAYCTENSTVGYVEINCDKGCSNDKCED